MDFRNGTHAVQHGHPQVEQRHVWTVVAPKLYGLAPVGAFGDDHHIGLHANNRRQSRSHRHVVVGNQHPDLVNSSTPYPVAGVDWSVSSEMLRFLGYGAHDARVSKVCASGRTMEIAVPLFLALCILSRPPIACARSFIPCKPKPSWRPA